jgi:hypothetical protein
MHFLSFLLTDIHTNIDAYILLKMVSYGVTSPYRCILLTTPITRRHPLYTFLSLNILKLLIQRAKCILVFVITNQLGHLLIYKFVDI